MLQHLAKSADAARGQCLHRACGNAVHPDFFRPKIVSEIARACFETGFRNTHDVVVRHNFFRAVIGHGHNAPAICHHRRNFACQRDQRIGADVVGNAECFPRGAYEISFERFLRREGDRVKKKIDLIRFAADFFEKRFDLRVA